MADDKISIAITGASGQLGQCLKDSAPDEIELHLFSREEMDIANSARIEDVFRQFDFDYLINCAAFTGVDLAESHEEEAYLLNAEAVKHLAVACQRYNVILIHISSDYVYDNGITRPLVESDPTSPKSVYASSKLKGDLLAMEVCDHSIVIRTSWLYSEYGHNFVKTMLRLGRERDALRIVSDQHGIPTYARDLANAIYRIVTSNKGSFDYGIYHFANSNPSTWYDFAKAILSKSHIDTPVTAIETKDFPTPAKRPRYSVLDSSKFSDVFAYEIRSWQDSLDECLLRVALKSNTDN